ncbi:hypothetical protein LZ32DRAFT_39055 [Colletotrichum eremochloae]|nr:hypothetical protein LZ32DRAFT_39055 [Colletotrichum eremochloae]
MAGGRGPTPFIPYSPSLICQLLLIWLKWRGFYIFWKGPVRHWSMTSTRRNRV